MSNNLEEAIEEFRKNSECVASIYDETVRCYQDLKRERKLRKDTMEVIFSSTEIEETGRALRMTPSVVFTGEKNCGKSSILNELLGKSYLPVHSTPCTSRIVKISNSSDENTFRVINKAGIEVQPVATLCSEGVRKCVVVPDHCREHQHELTASVEIKLNHPLLKSGIELIDSPGRNESDALDDIVDGFFATGTTPLIVYVIDGNQHLTPADRQAIRLLQGKCPHVSFLFVCNKVDSCGFAKRFDDRESSSDDSEDGQENEEVDKGKVVFLQLQRYGYIPEDESFESCSNFHGISAMTVRKERRENLKGKATEMFRKFETCLLNTLEKTVKRQTNQVIGKLLSTLLKFIAVVNKEKGYLTLKKSFFELDHDLNAALAVGNSLLSESTTLIANEEKVRSLVKCNLINIEETCLREADGFSPEKTDWRVHEVKSLQRDIPGFTKLSRRSFYSDEVPVPFVQLLAVMKGVILDKSFNVLRCVVNAHLHGTTRDVVERMSKHRRCVAHPFVQAVLDDVYAPARSRGPGDELINQLEEVSSAVLREKLATILNDGLSSVAKRKSVPTSTLLSDTIRSRREVVREILSRLSPEKVSEAITEACAAHLAMRHDTFVNTVTQMKTSSVSLGSCLEELKELSILYSPRVKYLAMRAFALYFSLCRGKLKLGPLVKSTKHGDIFSCSGWPEGMDTEPMAVKIVEKEKVEAKVWEQTASDLIHSWEIQREVEPTCKNLLYLYGWLTPNPGTIQIVMERADVDLTTALLKGLSLKMRMKIAIDVASGIKAIHSANYIHQDLKADSLLLAKDRTAKINMARPEKPFEKTRQGTPFHISRKMYKNYGKGLGGAVSYDIYAFGALLWVLCEGSGLRRPQAYDNYCTVEAMEIAVGKNIFPERPSVTSDACWKLMSKCWQERDDFTIDDVLYEMKRIYAAA